MLSYQILEFNIYRRIKKSQTKTINLKQLLQHGLKKLNYLMGRTLYQAFTIHSRKA